MTNRSIYTTVSNTFPLLPLFTVAQQKNKKQLTLQQLADRINSPGYRAVPYNYTSPITTSFMTSKNVTGDILLPSSGSTTVDNSSVSIGAQSETNTDGGAGGIGTTSYKFPVADVSGSLTTSAGTTGTEAKSGGVHATNNDAGISMANKVYNFLCTPYRAVDRAIGNYVDAKISEKKSEVLHQYVLPAAAVSAFIVGAYYVKTNYYDRIEPENIRRGEKAPQTESLRDLIPVTSKMVDHSKILMGVLGGASLVLSGFGKTAKLMKEYSTVSFLALTVAGGAEYMGASTLFKDARSWFDKVREWFESPGYAAYRDKTPEACIYEGNQKDAEACFYGIISKLRYKEGRDAHQITTREVIAAAHSTNWLHYRNMSADNRKELDDLWKLHQKTHPFADLIYEIIGNDLGNIVFSTTARNGVIFVLIGVVLRQLYLYMNYASDEEKKIFFEKVPELKDIVLDDGGKKRAWALWADKIDEEEKIFNQLSDEDKIVRHYRLLVRYLRNKKKDLKPKQKRVLESFEKEWEFPLDDRKMPFFESFESGHGRRAPINQTEKSARKAATRVRQSGFLKGGRLSGIIRPNSGSKNFYAKHGASWENRQLRDMGKADYEKWREKFEHAGLDYHQYVAALLDPQNEQQAVFEFALQEMEDEVGELEEEIQGMSPEQEDAYHQQRVSNEQKMNRRGGQRELTAADVLKPMSSKRPQSTESEPESTDFQTMFASVKLLTESMSSFKQQQEATLAVVNDLKTVVSLPKVGKQKVDPKKRGEAFINGTHQIALCENHRKVAGAIKRLHALEVKAKAPNTTNAQRIKLNHDIERCAECGVCQNCATKNTGVFDTETKKWFCPKAPVLKQLAPSAILRRAQPNPIPTPKPQSTIKCEATDLTETETIDYEAISSFVEALDAESRATPESVTRNMEVPSDFKSRCNRVYVLKPEGKHDQVSSNYVFAAGSGAVKNQFVAPMHVFEKNPSGRAVDTIYVLANILDKPGNDGKSIGTRFVPLSRPMNLNKKLQSVDAFICANQISNYPIDGKQCVIELSPRVQYSMQPVSGPCVMYSLKRDMWLPGKIAVEGTKCLHDCSTVEGDSGMLLYQHPSANKQMACVGFHSLGGGKSQVGGSLYPNEFIPIQAIEQAVLN